MCSGAGGSVGPAAGWREHRCEYEGEREGREREMRDERSTTPCNTGGTAGRLRDCLGSERMGATTSVLSLGVISREWASCMTNTVGWRVREGMPPSERRSRSRRVRNSEWSWAQTRASMRRAGQRWSESTTVNQPASVLLLPCCSCSMLHAVRGDTAKCTPAEGTSQARTASPREAPHLNGPQ